MTSALRHEDALLPQHYSHDDIQSIKQEFGAAFRKLADQNNAVITTLTIEDLASRSNLLIRFDSQASKNRFDAACDNLPPKSPLRPLLPCLNLKVGGFTCN